MVLNKSEVEEIAIEFAEWIATRFTLSKYKEWCILGMPTTNTTKDLFEEFLNQRND